MKLSGPTDGKRLQRRAMAKPTVLSLVERGWQAARERSLDLQRDDVEVLHLIKGRVDPGVLALVTPYPRIRVVSIPRRWFRLLAWGWLLRLTAQGVLQAVMVDNEKSLGRLRGWVRLIGVPLEMVQAGPAGYEVRRADRADL